ncbi:MAG: TAXI family TRAP transporter solute-binding subunit [Acidobacteria bacterium]|nr:TAXI family TRAP transporter solute-binding subunit [Acidobacteriota bacterium]
MRWRLGAGAVISAACAVGCSTPEATAVRTPIVLSIPFTGNAWETIGRALGDEYNRRFPHLAVNVVTAESLESQVDAMEGGKVDLALEDAETAYLAFTRGTAANASAHERLRAVGVTFSIAVQVAVPDASGITSIEQLKGRRVDVGARGGSVERAAHIILESYGLTYRNIEPTFGTSDTLARFKDRTLDARFFYSAFKHPTIDGISREVDVRVLPIDRRVLGAIQEQHHFLKSTLIPAGTYPKQPSAVQTVGMDVLLLCRKDLPDAVVYDLTRGLFDAVPALERAHEAARAIDVERGPTASIPLHPGAARYYREREILQ